MKIKEKLTKVDEEMTITKYDNGYFVNVSGVNEDDDWSSAKILCLNFADLLELVSEFDKLPKRD